MGKTKIKKMAEEITPVIASDNEAISEAVSNEEQIAASRRIPFVRDPRESGSPTAPRNDDLKKEKKSKAKKVKRQRSKKYQQALEGIEKSKKLAAAEAVESAQKGSYSKFEGTIEAHINTNAKNLRGLVNMPFAQGKKLRILAFGANADKSGADIIGSDGIIADINKGKIDFDVMITTPEWMPKLASIAKILGPRSLMPNPKNGTITENLEKAIAELQGGKTEYKTEKDGQVIHLAVGKVSQKPEEIVANLKVIYNTVGRSKISKISLSPTMGPSVKVDLQSL